MRIRRFTLSFLVLLMLASEAMAADVQLLLISSEKAIILVEGERRLLTKGDRTPEGIELLAIEEDVAIVEIDGETRHLSLSKKLAGTESPPQVGAANATTRGNREYRVFADNQGMFRTTGNINGFPVDFILDTGATTVVLNAEEARRLGIDYRMDGKIITVTTASRQERGYLVNLRSVKLGQIEVLNVEATVLDGEFPTKALLGMSFLGRLESQRTPNMLLLRKLY